ncbi:glycosyltransferase [Flavobacterium sp. NST-5]|uniref:Glycosyltransferase n=1 Tax=Flavobacterium ichthyis TaxID=2698827 RepID=A0ABW9ZEV0_9FLAO|nr:glycosyltransferase family 4 protein [Flavobacterium ichthyis]NBL65787.1 glycosyltransferase [Flavobacterium ichthyis]
MKYVLVINQSAELYGADKAILELIENFPNGYTPIVVLHEDGPLKLVLQEMGIEVIHSSVIKIKRGIFNFSYLLQLPFEIIGSLYRIRKSLKGKEIALVHSNAISVFIGAFYSFVFRKKHLWHVHEIIENPEIAAKAYPKIVAFFSNLMVFNSQASYNQFYKYNKKIANRSVVIHNGQNRNVPPTNEEVLREIRSTYFKATSSQTVIGLVGRISRLKGQQVLLGAFQFLVKKYDNVKLVYIGSAPKGQSHYLTALEEKIVENNLENDVEIIDFQEQIWPFYDALDIVVVPSTEPESFGLVATEAMLSNKPVVASDLGGLKEIIVHEKTGYLFEPGNVNELFLALEKLVLSEDLRVKMGLSGNLRVRNNFTANAYATKFKNAYDGLTSTK